MSDDIINEIIEKSVRTVVESINDNDFRVEDFFDLDSITYKQLQSINVDMRIFLQGRGFGEPISPDGELINETIVKTVPIKELRYRLKNLGFWQWQIKSQIAANKVRVVILYVDIAKNTDTIENEMKMLGWTKAHISPPFLIKGFTCRAMDFDPMMQRSLSKQARKYEYLYHWTPESNVPLVMKNGLLPKSENAYLSYDPKVHLMKGDIPDEDAKLLGWQLFNHNMKIMDGKYTLLRITTKLVPDNVEFYGDPRYPYGFFTWDPIPPSAIEPFGRIQLTDKSAYKSEPILPF